VADSVGLFGDRVHILTQTPDQAMARAEGAFTEAGLELLGIQPIEPALEDVFISVLGEKQKEDLRANQ